MPRKAKRPSVPVGFLALRKHRLEELDFLPPGLWRTYIKLLNCASWGAGSCGVLGFCETPWSLRDIAAATNMDAGNLSKALRQLQSIGLPDGEATTALVSFCELTPYGHSGYYLPHYEYFVKCAKTPL